MMDSTRKDFSFRKAFKSLHRIRKVYYTNYLFKITKRIGKGRSESKYHRGMSFIY